MAIAGRKPKAEGQRVNRHALKHDWTDVKDIPFADAPKLPSKRLQGKSWPTLTRRWWKAISTMPHCVLWSDSDWQYAIDTALIAAEFHDGDVKAAAELRAREKLLGNTVEHRRDMRIRYIDPDAAEASPLIEDEDTPSAGVAQMEDYRNVL
ncbi:MULTISPECIES: hypothetical protein [Rhodococcus]|uniref:Bacteriophage protein n=1 Tax=Rhodococcus erythropolis (strain PR4 / NBRC 100887) TaxID=234621 RepID=C0ZX99_RHOE4|nr:MULTISPECIES: hypothetical protein [Rhodococcus]BAH32984.1 hypothetical protein RER_22760 [Rhodococcus erythropolis PR4]